MPSAVIIFVKLLQMRGKAASSSDCFAFLENFSLFRCRISKNMCNFAKMSNISYFTKCLLIIIH